MPDLVIFYGTFCESKGNCQMPFQIRNFGIDEERMAVIQYRQKEVALWWMF